MALTVSVAEVAGQWTVRATATGYIGTVTWTRDEGGRETDVGTGPEIIDRHAPLNTPLYYIAKDDVAIVPSAEITVVSTHPILASSMYGTTAQVTIVSQQPNTWRARSRWHPVLDRTDGPVVTIFDAEWREGNLQLRLADRNERHELLTMLMKGDPLILRSTCPERVDELTILPTEWSDPYVVDGQWESGQNLDIRYQAVTPEPPAYVPPPQWTYADVLALHATYDAVLDSYATYADLLAGIQS